MLLSEAIRLGAMLRPQIIGSTLVRDGSCAWGAAYEATGAMVVGGHFPSGYATKHWPWSQTDVLECPHCHNRRELSGWIMAHLNDEHRWTRERIADWVEQQERERGLIPAPVAEEAEVVHLSRGA